MRPEPSIPASDLASWLRGLPALTGTAPPLDHAELSTEPETLFRAWIADAAAAGVPEPHAATLATVDAEGVPDARMLILKGLDEGGWAFAGPRSSRKGAQLAAVPAAALSFWWQPLVRAVRVRGTVREATPEESAADLAARSAAARDGIEPGDWTLWRIQASRVEFWQGSADRRHTRIVYDRLDDGWRRSIAGAAGTMENDMEEQA